MPKYVTQQRKKLLSYLSRHTDTLLSVREIADYLQGEDISRSSVYRNLADLEVEGKVRRGCKGAAREVFFQYVGAAGCRDHLHLYCRRCGKTIHIDADLTDLFVGAVEKLEGFEIDRSASVLEGICGACRK